MKYILGIETSCDDTGIALVNHDHQLIGEIKYSSATIQAQYGGVVPEIAARMHAQTILQLTLNLLKQHAISFSDISHIAYTNTPGLVGCLLVGTIFAKTLSWLMNIPLIPTNHLFAHIFSVGLTNQLVLPYLALVASGKTTAIYQVNSLTEIKLLTKTQDDAIGETLDKVGREMQLNYPAGPQIDALFQPQWKLPWLAKFSPVHADFSFSGIKTAAIKAWNQLEERDLLTKQKIISTQLQSWILKTVVDKLVYYQQQTNINQLVIVGGVAANTWLRKHTQQHFQHVMLVDLKYATDNGAMIAYYGSWLAQTNYCPKPK